MKHEARKQKGIGLAQANPRVSSTQRNASVASPSLVKQGFFHGRDAEDALHLAEIYLTARSPHIIIGSNDFILGAKLSFHGNKTSHQGFF